MLGILYRIGSVIAWIFLLVACMGGCIGCPIKSKPIPSVDKSVKGQCHDSPTASKELNPGLSESFWTPSTCDMDNSTVQSIGSISSFSTSTQMHDTHCISDPNAHAEFVNHGLLLWNQTRHKWIGNRKPRTSVVQREPKWSWNATYDSLLGSNKPFPKPVPLGEMVDFLVDIWEQEGMYD